MAIILDESGGVLYAEDGAVLYDEASSFPQIPVDLRCDLNLGGAWVNVSSYLYQREGTQSPAAISRGRPDEASQVNASSAVFEANNRSGNWSPKNPLGAWYGQIGRNTPVRLSVPAQVNYLRLETDASSLINTPSSSSLNVAGDLELQMDVNVAFALTGQAIPLMRKWPASGQLSWLAEVRPDGLVNFWRSPDGTTGAVVTSTLPLPPGRVALKITYASASGAVTFYTAPTIAGAWAQLGAAGSFGSGATLFAGTGPVQMGSTGNPGMTGSVYALKMLSGIGGTVVASPDFSLSTPGNTTLTDAQGNVWTLGGTAEFSNRNYRYHGELSSLPGKWDVTGTDVSAPVTAGGLLRRIGQGQAPVMSPMKRGTLLQAGTLAPVAYWPCEDAAGATSLGSATGGPAMYIGSQVQLSSDSTFAASAPLPVLNGSLWHGNVPGYTSNGSVVVRFLMHLGSTIPSGTTIVRAITTGTCQEVSVLVIANSQLRIIGNGAGGSSVFDSGTLAFTNMPNPVWVSIELRPGGGGTVNWGLATLVPGAANGVAASGSFSGSTGNVTDVYVSPRQGFTDTVVGHISVQSDWVSLFSLAGPLQAWQGEAAGSRFARLAAENGYQARVIGAPAASALMGTQSVAAFAQLLQECETADMGQIFEPRQALAIGYRTLASMTNQAAAVTLDYAQAQPGGVSGDASDGGLDPTYDDQLTRNDMTVTRSAGSSSGATYQFQLNDGSSMSISAPPAGVGDYASTATVNVSTDAQLPDEAGWLVHIGTVDEARWPQIPLNLARTALSSLYYTLLGCDIGDYAAIINMITQVTRDPVKQLLFQVKETLGGFHHTLEWTGVPESPYEVAVYDDPVYGRADTDGASLHSAATSGATSLSVDTASGFPLWTTAAADFPFDINIGGERITVTNITGASSPQAFTVTRAVNGVSKAHTAGEDVRLWYPPILALT